MQKIICKECGSNKVNKRELKNGDIIIVCNDCKEKYKIKLESLLISNSIDVYINNLIED